jgi:hypothetical protein
LTVKAAGQTGVVFPVNTSGTVVFNGTDYVLLGSYVIASAGTASLPSITFTGDTNTGIFSPAADTIAFAEGGVESARFDASGNMGLAVTPSAWKSNYKAFQVGNATAVVGRTDNNNNYFSSNWFVNSSNQDIYQNTGFATIYAQNSGIHAWYTAASGTAGNAITFTEAMRIDSSGNVLVGTTSAVNNWNNSLIKMRIANGIQFGNYSAIAEDLFDADSLGICCDSTENLCFGQYTSDTTTYTERMRIDSSGNVGIGTASPGQKLAISSADASGTAVNIINTSTGGYSWNIFSVGSTASLGPVGSLAFRDSTNGQTRALIDTGGEFLINTTSQILASRVLQAKRSGGGVAILKVESGVGSEVLLLWNDATSGNNLFQEFGTETSIVVRGSIDYNRGAGLVRYNTSSDATLKNIIGDSDGAKSVEILNSTRIREFAWKDDPAQKPQIGVIAQELYETYKGAVSVGGNHEETIPAVTEQRLVSEAVLDENGNEIEAAVYETVEVEPERKETKYRPWGVDKTAFTFHLVAGWQAHEKLIKQQAETIAALEARIAALEAK